MSCPRGRSNLALLGGASILSLALVSDGSSSRHWSALASSASPTSPINPRPLPPSARGHRGGDAAVVLGEGSDIDPPDEGEGSQAPGEKEEEAHAMVTDAASALALAASAKPPKASDVEVLVDNTATGAASKAFGMPTAVADRRAATANGQASAGQSGGNGNSGGSGGGGWFGKILGGNKGNSNSNQKETGVTAASAGSKGAMLPPPPPPPPLSSMSDGDGSGESMGSKAQHQQQQHASASGDTQQQWQAASISGQTFNSWGPPPPRQKEHRQQQNPYPQQQQHQQYPPPPNNLNYYPSLVDQNSYQAVLRELDESTLREMTLTYQLQNLTSLVSSMTSESESLVARIDVLTERLADSEANWNYVHNRNLELDANCTSLSQLGNELREEVASYEVTMEEMRAERAAEEGVVLELRTELRKVTDELEKLACLVETERHEAEKSTHLEELRRRQVQKRKKKRGFWAWIFGFEGDFDEASRSCGDADEPERRRAAQELARSTLLHALQSERVSVEELESAVSALQRNNSAIMDVVASRDSLIAELNSRVAVFEEDKMFLKAALRQLQLEIKEEEPRIQKIVDDLEEAVERERTLKIEMEELLLEHTRERDEWEGERAGMVKERNKTKEELELIGLYVDQLEDRLADFAIARKELQSRERECGRLESEAAKRRGEIEEYRRQASALAREGNETGALLEELVRERAAARVEMERLTGQVRDLNNQIEGWKGRVEEAERRNEEIRGEGSRQLFLKVEEEKAAWARDSARKMEDAEAAWRAEGDRELRQLLESERAGWETDSAREREARLAAERLAWSESAGERLRREKSDLEDKLNREWSMKLEGERNDAKGRYEGDLQQRLADERARWEEEKEEELRQRLEEERSSWEDEMEARREEERASSSSEALEAEVERAAANVYERLEKNRVSFGGGDALASPPLLDPTLKDLLSSDNKFGDCSDTVEKKMIDDGSKTKDLSEGASDDDDDVAGSSLNTEEGEGTESGENKTEDESDSLSSMRDVSKKVPEEESASSISLPARDAIPPQQPMPTGQRLSAIKPANSVPFRSIRKAFSRATGLHGLITPSTIQLRQRELRKIYQQRRQQRQQTQKQKREEGKFTDGTGDGDSNSIVKVTGSSGNALAQGGGEGDGDGSSADASSSSSPPAMQSPPMSDIQEEGGTSNQQPHPPPLEYPAPLYDPGSDTETAAPITAEDAWGSGGSHHHYRQFDAGGLVASLPSWSAEHLSGDIKEPPPFPEIDDR